jgi:phage-related protein (TIGR01555 family)
MCARTLQHTELENLYAGDGFARRVIDLPAEEMLRAGYDIEGIDDGAEVLAALEDIQVNEKLVDALRWNYLYGGSIVVMLINDGGLLEDPLNIEAAKSIEQLRVYDRHQVTHRTTYDDPADMRFGRTETYMVSPIRGTPYQVHESRCLVFDGVPVPARVRETYDSWGASRLQQCYDQLQRFGMSHYWANQLLERSQQAVHGIPGLSDMLRSTGGEAAIQRRVDLVDMARSVNNTVIIDALETYDLKSTSLSGVSDIMDRMGLALSAVTGMPEALLFGRQQGGLNSTGESDLENWYAKIAQEQTTILLPQIDKIVTIQLHVMGKYTEDYLIKFNPLSVPSAKDKSETDYKRAQTYEILSVIGALDPSEIRHMLPDEGYQIDNIDQMPELPEQEVVKVATPVKDTEPVKDELKDAQIDLIRAQAENLRKEPKLIKADVAPVAAVAPVTQPQQVVFHNHIPEIKAPDVHVTVSPEVKAPDVHVTVTPEVKAPDVVVNPSTVVKMDTPIVNIAAPATQKVEVVKMPKRKTKTKVLRDERGEMSGSTTEEEDI